jgi:hypothetical protein
MLVTFGTVYEVMFDFRSYNSKYGSFVAAKHSTSGSSVPLLCTYSIVLVDTGSIPFYWQMATFVTKLQLTVMEEKQV